MKFISTILITALLSFVACLYLPAWSVAVVAFVIAIFIYQPPLKAFASGFTALFLLWGILAFVYSSNNAHILAQKVATIVLKSNSPGFLISITALLGAVMGGFGALTGSLLRRLKTA